MNSMSGFQGMSHQTSDRAFDRGLDAMSLSSMASGSENLSCGFAPHYVMPTKPQPAPGTGPTAVNSSKSDNTYVSFDEWRAQVHAKMSLVPANNAASTSSVDLPYGGRQFGQQPLSWLSSAKAPCGRQDF